MTLGVIPSSRDERAVSGVLSLVLLIGLTVTGVSVVMLVGAFAITDTQRETSLLSTEQSMAQFDSRAALVAHGSATTKHVTLSTGGETLTTESNAGWLNVTIQNATPSGDRIVVVNDTLGAVRFHDERTTIAYQGGGVWKKDDTGSVMVSPPEFHYQTARTGPPTLTLPLIAVTSDDVLPASVTIRRDETERKFPNTASNRSNPLDRGAVEIAVHSEFYEAWARYFETRTESDVTVDHPNNTARIELVIPFDEDFEQVLATTDPHGITANPGPPPSPHQMGIGYPNADSLIEERIEECETNASACETSPPDPLTNGTYYYNTSLTGDLDINTSEGDVVLVVNGSFTPGTVNVTGPHNVTVYVNGDFAFGGIDTINYGGDAVAFTAIVHSTGDVDMNGAFRYVGFVYAPGSDVDLNGGGPPWFVNVRGGIVGKTIDINGHPNKFEYDASISDIEIDTETGLSTITYLHVSRTTINVTGPP